MLSRYILMLSICFQNKKGLLPYMALKMLNNVQTSFKRWITDRKKNVHWRKLTLQTRHMHILPLWIILASKKSMHYFWNTGNIHLVLYNFYFLIVKYLSILVTLCRAIKWHPSFLAHWVIICRREEHLKWFKPNLERLLMAFESLNFQ